MKTRSVCIGLVGARWKATNNWNDVLLNNNVNQASMYYVGTIRRTASTKDVVLPKKIVEPLFQSFQQE